MENRSSFFPKAQPEFVSVGVVKTETETETAEGQLFHDDSNEHIDGYYIKEEPCDDNQEQLFSIDLETSGFKIKEEPDIFNIHGDIELTIEDAKPDFGEWDEEIVVSSGQSPSSSSMVEEDSSNVDSSQLRVKSFATFELQQITQHNANEYSKQNDLCDSPTRDSFIKGNLHKSYSSRSKKGDTKTTTALPMKDGIDYYDKVNGNIDSYQLYGYPDDKIYNERILQLFTDPVDNSKICSYDESRSIQSMETPYNIPTRTYQRKERKRVSSSDPEDKNTKNIKIDLENKHPILHRSCLEDNCESIPSTTSSVKKMHVVDTPTVPAVEVCQSVMMPIKADENSSFSNNILSPEGLQNNTSYDPRHECPFCKKRFSGNIRHLLRAHEERVRYLLDSILTRSLALSKEQMMILLSRAGDFQHNLAVLANEKGDLIVLQPSKIFVGLCPESSFTPCPECAGFVHQSQLSSHYQKCVIKPTTTSTLERSLITESEALLATINGNFFNLDFKVNVLDKLTSSFGVEAKGDYLIKALGKHILMTSTAEVVHVEARAAMLRMGCLLACARKALKIVKSGKFFMYQLLELSNLKLLNNTILRILKDNGGKKNKKLYDLFINNITTCVFIWKGKCLSEGNILYAVDLARFHHAFLTDLKTIIMELTDVNPAKVRTESFPLVSDIIQLKDTLTVKMVSLTKQVKGFSRNVLEDSKQPEQLIRNMYYELAEVVMSLCCLFNHVNLSVIELLTIAEYAARPDWGVDNREDYISFTHNHKYYMSEKRVIIPVRSYNSTAVLVLTAEMKQAIDVMLRWRIEADVSLENPFVFGRQKPYSKNALKVANGFLNQCVNSGPLKHYVLKNETTRRYLTHVVQISDMSPQELSWVKESYLPKQAQCKGSKCIPFAQALADYEIHKAQTTKETPQDQLLEEETGPVLLHEISEDKQNDLLAEKSYQETNAGNVKSNPDLEDTSDASVASQPQYESSLVVHKSTSDLNPASEVVSRKFEPQPVVKSIPVLKKQSIKIPVQKIITQGDTQRIFIHKQYGLATIIGQDISSKAQNSDECHEIILERDSKKIFTSKNSIIEENPTNGSLSPQKCAVTRYLVKLVEDRNKNLNSNTSETQQKNLSPQKTNASKIPLSNVNTGVIEKNKDCEKLENIATMAEKLKPKAEKPCSVNTKLPPIRKKWTEAEKNQVKNFFRESHNQTRRPWGTSTRDDLERATELVLIKKVSKRQASKAFNINHNTLDRYIRKKIENPDVLPSLGVYGEHNKVFDSNLEIELLEELKACADIFFGLAPSSLKTIVFEFAVKKKCIVPESWVSRQMPGQDWYFSFVKRNPSIMIRRHDFTGQSQTKYCTVENLNPFYDKLLDIMNEYKFEPENIYNLDEIEINLPATTCSAASGKENYGVSVGLAVNTCGGSIPPMFVFPTELMITESALNDLPHGSIGVVNSSGQVQMEEFLQLLRHFQQQVKCTVDKKVLLLLDNACSHVQLKALDFCRCHGIVLLSFPFCTALKLQPLVSIKKLVDAEMSKMMETPLKTSDVTSTIAELISSVVTKKKIKAAFKRTGIYPMDRLQIKVKANKKKSPMSGGVVAVELKQGSNYVLRKASEGSKSSLTANNSIASTQENTDQNNTRESNCSLTANNSISLTGYNTRKKNKRSKFQTEDPF